MSDKKMFWFALGLILLPLTLAFFGGDRFRYPCQDPENWDKPICQKPACDVTRTFYNKIVTWHNDDATPQGLKHLSIEIIQDCTNNTLKQIGLEDIVTDVKIEK